MADHNFTLIFPHIPKTGGTTLLYHFSKTLGEERTFVLGRHSRVRRFLGNQPQFEFIPDAETAKINVFQGHGVNQGILPWIDPDRARLIVVLRDPVARTKSAFGQQSSRHARAGDTLSVEAFMRKNWDNMISKALARWFPDFIEDKSAPLSRQACDVLRCFDYVLTTDGMDQQLPPLLEHLGLPAQAERRRVAKRGNAIAFDEDAIAARNTEDLAVLEACSKPTEFQDGRFNALGFDADARAAGMARVRAVAAHTQSPAQREQYAYDELAKGLCIGLQAEKALAKLDRDGTDVALPDPGAFRKVLEEVWETNRKNLSPAQAETSKLRLEKYKKRFPPRKARA